MNAVNPMINRYMYVRVQYLVQDNGVSTMNQ